MIAGASLPYWVGFHIVVLLLLTLDIVVLTPRDAANSMRRSVAWTVMLVVLSLAFGAVLFFTKGHRQALEFLSGYVIEGSLSIDNLFVFVILFRTFRLGELEQRRALNWGVIGAIVLRAIFIVGGIALLRRFSSIQYVFGAVLLYAAVRLMLENPRKHTKPPLAARLFGSKTARAPLLLAIVAIEVTDLIFAVDSVPAVLAVTHDTFLAYTSNIFAILGLRSLYFVLAGLLNRLHLLHYGLALVLAFVSLKMLLAHWIEIPVGISLLVILAVLAVFTAASLWIPAPKQAAAA